MALSSHERVGKALDVLKAGLQALRAMRTSRCSTLSDLRDLAERQGNATAFAEQVATLCAAHASKSSFLTRLRKQGM